MLVTLLAFLAGALVGVGVARTMRRSFSLALLPTSARRWDRHPMAAMDPDAPDIVPYFGAGFQPPSAPPAPLYTRETIADARRALRRGFGITMRVRE